jgi:hypothetical protein
MVPVIATHGGLSPLESKSYKHITEGLSLKHILQSVCPTQALRPGGRPIGRYCLARVIFFDESGPAKANGRPIFINRHHANGFKAFLAERIAMVAVSLRFISLGTPFGIGEPNDCVAFRLTGNRGRQGINFLLSRRER